MRNIAVLGSTGSIGTQTLDVVRNNKDLNITALSANSNIGLLEKQIREFHPKIVCLMDESYAKELENNIKDMDVKVLTGMDGLIECATYKSTHTLVTAIVGMIGIIPTIEAIKAGKDIALANKETLVCAGHIIMPLVKKHKVSLYPVDSEHSAIFQAINGENDNELTRIILTASGGPFRGKTKEELKNVVLEDALNHPNWSMGKKITVDSSTLVNKGLEVIEAKWLFDIDFDRIEVVIQPQSIIHSAVEFIDGSIMAQMGTPDMRLPIQYALYYPKRKALSGERIDFFKLAKLDFEKPDNETFPALELAYKVGKAGGSLPTVFNAANEIAVEKFLNGKIRYLEIVELITSAIEAHSIIPNPTVSQILEIEKNTHEYINCLVK